MQLITLAIAIVIFISGITVRHLSKRSQRDMAHPALISTPIPTSAGTNSPLPTNSSNPKSTIQITLPPTVSTSIPDQTNTSIWLYPGATILENGTTVTLESQDSSDAITSWYESKIRSLNLQTKSFVKTKSNNTILNKLAAAGNNTEIHIEISKSETDSNVKIIVEVN